MTKTQELYSVSKITIISLLTVLFFTSFVIVSAGERGVLMKFGEVQQRVLGEGIHLIIPLVNTVKKLSVRVQNKQINVEAFSKDLQKVFTDVAVNWHIIPEEANTIFQQLGDENEVVKRIINPVVKEVLKTVMAKYTAEKIITNQEEIKATVKDLLTARMASYHIEVDDISTVSFQLTDEFAEAVEEKQIAEQEAKRADFIVLKASKEAEVKINLAKGEAEAQRLVRETLSPEVLQKQAIEKWDGKLPLIVGKNGANLVDLSKFVTDD